ncbi:helix-turn-helix domain-containing protein [Natrialba asiatica]|uniref:HVO-A0261-like N-terminal domain-containing protein n=1 Tax=Natrialba asiatica (strain ATCC 700177 / DSM 12278 / JCM 9576 / FERM P-10747 / NBRC 102637 / 172P1) TaxID=29540 RepID=M0B5D6_NATA1|nr:helix-turn-helix domain-containing protein [Natrialba asiatica]ELZ04874.1 hypothetical protein C481_03807 [Natrialba asiatica DSM 12278]
MSDEIVTIVCQHADALVSLQESPKYKRELAEELEVSKSTVYNIHRRLSEHGLVMKTDGKYTLTERGVIAITAYKGYKEQTEVLKQMPHNRPFEAEAG